MAQLHNKSMQKQHQRIKTTALMFIKTARFKGSIGLKLGSC